MLVRAKPKQEKFDLSKVKFGKDCPPRNLKLEAETPKEGIVERELPGGQWERVYYGKDVAAARGELQSEGERAAHYWASQQQFKLRQRGKAARYYPEERAVAFERMGTLMPIRDLYVSGFGRGRRGCDLCGGMAGGLRYVEGSGFLCKRRCLEAAMERVS